jgi:hypothetical protein
MNSGKRWFRRKREFEREISEELRFHIERQTAANIAAGMTPEEARRQARLQLGAVEGLKESCREERRGFLLEALWSNVRYGLRMMRRNPGFTMVVVLTLALGIGANSAVFSAIDAILLRPLPFPDGHQLMKLSQNNLKVKIPQTFVAPVRVEDWNRVSGGKLLNFCINALSTVYLNFSNSARLLRTAQFFGDKKFELLYRFLPARQAISSPQPAAS